MMPQLFWTAALARSANSACKSMKPLSSRARQRAFSLVEVTMAIGIISFALLALVGLLPQGLRMLKNANERSAAAGAFSRLTGAVRNGTFDGVDRYQAATYTNLSWRIGSSDRVNYTEILNYSGQPVVQASDNPRLVARVELMAPPSLIGMGRARVSIAWPATAVWEANTGVWRNAEGFITQGIIFVPKS